MIPGYMVTPTNGTPTVQVSGLQGAANPSNFSNNSSVSGDRSKYSSWNGDFVGYLTYMADHGDSASLDRLMNYLMTNESESSAREWTASREDTQYQRLVSDLKKAGINPYVLLSGSATPISSASPSHGYSGSMASSYDINQQKVNQNWLKVGLSAMLPIIGAIISAFL